MSEERKPWEQMIDKGEPDLWYGRFRVYLLMGSRRSVGAVYRKEYHVKARQTTFKISGDWYEAAKQWNWESRARDHDEFQRAEEDRIIADEKEKVLRSGYALLHKRVKTLDRLTRKLERWEKNDDKIWIPETRTTIMGENKSVTIEKVTFNHHLYMVIDKYLDSIAKEVGERVKKQELTGKNGEALEFEIELVGNKPEEEDEGEG